MDTKYIDNGDGTFKVVETTVPALNPDDLVLEKNSCAQRVDQTTRNMRAACETQIQTAITADIARIAEIDATLLDLIAAGATIHTPEEINAAAAQDVAASQDAETPP